MNTGLLVGVVAGAIMSGTSLLYATLGEVVGERAGIVNLGLEGIMLIGAASAFRRDGADGLRLSWRCGGCTCRRGRQPDLCLCGRRAPRQPARCRLEPDVLRHRHEHVDRSAVRRHADHRLAAAGFARSGSRRDRRASLGLRPPGLSRAADIAFDLVAYLPHQVGPRLAYRRRESRRPPMQPDCGRKGCNTKPWYLPARSAASAALTCRWRSR